VNDEKPYSEEDYEDAKKQGLDLDDWNDYVKYYDLHAYLNE
jgi:hypothetical protein